MTGTLAQLIAASRKIEVRLANRDTPFIFDCWYVAGFVEEFGRDLIARTLLGRALVLFRTTQGLPVALDDRCPHRSYPLSKSLLEGDTIVCGYHGLRYTASGDCVEAPALREGCPKGIGVRSYPLREQGPLVWIWMGPGSPHCDPPLGEWIESDFWPASRQYYHLPASYIALHENLLDLTHLSFLHARTFGTPDYAMAPYELDLDEAAGRFTLCRTVQPTRLPPVWAEPTGLTGKDAVRITTSRFHSPSTHTVTGDFRAFGSEDDGDGNSRIITSHLLTPETATSTHYFIHHARNFAVDRRDVTDFMQVQLSAAFREDVEALTAIEENIASTLPEDRYEISLSSDRAGLAMRRWIYRAAMAEHGLTKGVN